VIVGEDSAFTEITIPAVVFTDPELAWCGLTESEAKAKGIAIEVAKFPWAASGRALSFDRPDGLTKLIIDPDTERILGVGIVGTGAGEVDFRRRTCRRDGSYRKGSLTSGTPHPHTFRDPHGSRLKLSTAMRPTPWAARKWSTLSKDTGQESHPQQTITNFQFSIRPSIFGLRVFA
jgi:hypothetical protein